MVNRSKKVSVSSESEESGSSSDSEDSTFVPQARNGRAQRRRKRQVEEDTDSNSDSEETIAAPRRRRRTSSGHREDVDDSRSSRRSAEDCDEGRNGKGKGKVLTRRNAKVLEAVWEKNTVKITYDVGVKHACMNPIHGKSKQTYSVLHLVQCSWRKNVSMMTEAPSIKKSKSFQYCHKLCEPCLAKYGSRCFKCGPQGDIKPILHTVFEHETINCVDEFRERVKRWQEIRDDADVKFLVLHCTVVGPEARNLRQRFDLRRSTVIHIVYSDVRDKMEPAGSGTNLNLEESDFQSLWETTMKEKVYNQDHNLVAFFGNILLNESLSFNDFRVNDLLLMYSPSIFDSLEETAIRLSINSLQLHMQSPRATPTECCLHDAVVHTHRKPTSEEDDCTFQHGNLVASVFYKAVKRSFGSKIVAEVEQRAGLGEDSRIGDEGHKLPFLKLYASRGGEVQFRRVASISQDVARRDNPRSRVCGWDTSGFEVVCWTQRGHPKGGDFVIPGLMYRFETSPGSTLIFRPTRYFHATLPTQNRDLLNEKFAAAFSTPT